MTSQLDQTESGRVTDSTAHAEPSAATVWAIGGGKGGVGKSFVATNLAVRAAQLGKRVILLDGDLGGANLDTLLGCPRPSQSLGHFFTRQVADLASIAVDTGIAGLQLIAGDADSLGAANPMHAQKLKLLRHLRKLDCDLVIMDLGAGTTFNTLDLFLAADTGLVVTNPEPTAVQNCFAFIKAATLRDLERRTGVKRRAIDRKSIRGAASEGADARAALARTTRLVVARAQPAEARRVTNMLGDLCGRFFGGRVQLSGVVRDDPQVPMSVRRMMPLCLLSAQARAALDIDTLARALLDPQPKVPRSPHLGVNEQVMVGDLALHVQTEDLGQAQAAIRTQVFLPDSSVAYSRRTPYVDAFFERLGAGPAERVRLHHAAIKRALDQGRIDLGRRRIA